MSSSPEIAPGAPAAAATGPRCHSGEARSPQPQGPLPSAAASFFSELSIYFPFRRLRAGWGWEGEGWDGGERRGPEGAVPRGWAQGVAAPPDPAVLLPLQGLGRSGGGSWPPAPPGPSPPFRRPRGRDIPVPLGAPRPPPVRPVREASPVLPVRTARRPARPPPQPWTPSRRRCRCSSSTRRTPWIERSRRRPIRRQRRTGASRSAPPQLCARRSPALRPPWGPESRDPAWHPFLAPHPEDSGSHPPLQGV